MNTNQFFSVQFHKFIKYKALLGRLVQRDLKVKYRRSVLGYLWSLLNPLLMMLVMTLVFSYMFRYSIPHYPIFLITGQVLFNFFNESTTMAMDSIINNSALIKKVYIPKYIFPLSRVLSSFVTFLFSLAAVVIVMIFTKTPFTPAILLFPIPLLYVLVFSIGFGMILSVCAVYFRDTRYLYSVLIMAWMYLTPIFYPLDALPAVLQPFEKFNPLYSFIECFRDIILYGQVPTCLNTFISISWCCLVLILGIVIFKRKQADFILYI